MKRQLAIQHVEISWGKEHRGLDRGGGAAERNALPRDAPFMPPGPSEEGWFQHFARSSREEFAPRERWTRIEDMDLDYSPVRWKWDDDYLWLGLRNLHLQKPHRAIRAGWFARLPIGQRVVLRINNAWDWRGYQRHYSEHHISVAVGATATLDLPLFREIEERKLLY